MTSNPKSLQNGQRSSSTPHAFGSNRSAAEVSQRSRIAAPSVNTKTIHGDPRLSRLPHASHCLVGRVAMSIVKWLTRFGRIRQGLSSVLPEALGWLLVRLLDLRRRGQML